MANTLLSMTESRNPAAFYQRFIKWLRNFFKRLFDICASIAGMIVLTPVFFYLAWRVRRDSPGPIFYRGPRVGENNKVFQILKFRTMHENPKSYEGPSITAQDDPRITPLGRWLRDTKLNELPQLWNVLVGEMSLVGPRPEDPAIAAEWPEEMRREILSMRPGVTSPASILYRDEENMLQSGKLMDTYMDEIAPSKMRLDQLYVRHHSFWGDLDIIFWTVVVLLPRMRSEMPPEVSLFAGPIDRFVSRHMAWFFADLLTTLVMMSGTILFWRLFINTLDVGWAAAFVLAIGFALLFSLVNVILGANRIVWSRALASDAIVLLPGMALATSLALLVNQFWPDSFLGIAYQGSAGVSRLLPPALILISSGLTYLAFIAVRYRTRLVTGLATRWMNWRQTIPAAQERALIIGSGESGQFAAWVLRNSKYADTLRVVGFVDDDPKKYDTRVHGVNVLGQCDDIPELVTTHDVGLIVFAIHNITLAQRRKLLDICARTPTHVAIFPDIPASLHNLGEAKGGLPQPAYLQDVRVFKPGDLAQGVPVHVEDWLSRLEQLARSGDLDGTLAEIQALRAQMRYDPDAQYTAALNLNEPADHSS